MRNEVYILQTDIVRLSLWENLAAQLAQFLGMWEFEQMCQIYLDSRSFKKYQRFFII